MLLAFLVGAAWSGLCSRTEASKPRLRLQRVQAETCATAGEISLQAAELELEGQVRPFEAARAALVVDGARLSALPRRWGKLPQTGATFRLALVVQATRPLREDWAAVQAALKALVEDLPPRTRLTLMTYGGRPIVQQADSSPAEVLSALRRLRPDETASNPALVDALREALARLERVPATYRAVLVVSDGINRSQQRTVFRALGRSAALQQIPIHPIAYSPTDERGPLLNLGELAKRSAGTLRWARGPADLLEQAVNQARELRELTSLTFSFPGRCQRPHRLELVSGALRSNALVLEPQPQPPGSLARWLFGGGVVLASAFLFCIAVWLTRGRDGRRRKRRE